MSGNNNNRGYYHRRNKNKSNKAENSGNNNGIECFGLHEEFVQKLQNQEKKSTSRNIVLPISTRGFGFMIKNLCRRISNTGVIRSKLNDLPLALYRFTLHQLELKLDYAMREQISTNIGNFDDFENAYLSEEKQNVCTKLGAYFQDIVDLLDCVGLVKCAGTLVIPRVPKGTNNSLDPCLVTIQNLRSYVEQLSDYRTPVESRMYFYEHSPLPLPEEAWTKEGDDNHPLLLNPDEVMPSDYNVQSLLKDLHTIMDIIDILPMSCRKDVPISFEKLSYGGFAKNYNILLSSNVADFVYRFQCEEFIFRNLFGEIPREASVNNFAVYNLRRVCVCRYPLKEITQIENVGSIFLNASYLRVKIPITTRGLGFIINHVVQQMHFKTLIYDRKESERKRMKMKQALYRISLLRLQKIVDLYNCEYVGLLEYPYNNGFRFIENYLSYVPTSHFESYKEVDFEFFVPARTTNPEYDFDPCLITFANLREYCLALSNAETPCAVRKYFYDHSPIPGAIWENIEDVGPILKNPDDVKPEKFDFREDTRTIDAGILTLYNQFYDSDDDDDFTYRDKQISKILTEDIAGNRKHQGSKATQMEILLSSTNIAPIGMNSTTVFHKFWSPLRNISSIGEELSKLYLFGEIPRAGAVLEFDDFLPRQPQCARSFWYNYVGSCHYPYL